MSTYQSGHDAMPPDGGAEYERMRAALLDARAEGKRVGAETERIKILDALARMPALDADGESTDLQDVCEMIKALP